jgi:hypothetical protein
VYAFNWDDIVDLARTYADERVVGYLSATELDRILNTLGRKLWDRSLSRGNEYPRRESTGTLTVSAATYSLATLAGSSSPVRVQRIILRWSSTDHEDLEQLEDRERSRYAVGTWGRYTPKGYLLNGAATDGITVMPTPNAATPYTIIWFAPWTARTYGATNTVTAPAGFDDVLALQGAIAMRQMQDMETGGLERRLADALAEFDRTAGERLNDSPHRVVDISPDGADWALETYLPRA